MYFTRFVALCCVLFFVQVTVSAQITNKKAAFRAIKTLEGVWFMPTDRGDRLEIWKVEDASYELNEDLTVNNFGPSHRRDHEW